MVARTRLSLDSTIRQAMITSETSNTMVNLLDNDSSPYYCMSLDDAVGTTSGCSSW